MPKYVKKNSLKIHKNRSTISPVLVTQYKGQRRHEHPIKAFELKVCSLVLC